MRVVLRALLVSLVLAWPAPRLAAQAPATAATPAPAPTLTDQEIETFLLTARVVSKKAAKKGVTNTIQATFSDGRITHDAQIQTVDVAMGVFQSPQGTEINFRDTYRYNIAGYRLARLLHMDNVPVSVERKVDGKTGAVTWWIDDVMMDEQGRIKEKNPWGPDRERTSKQLYIRRVFDELIQNKDRNMGNLLWTKDWTMWLIDHTRAFRFITKLMDPAVLARCDGVLLTALRGLTVESVTTAVGQEPQERGNSGGDGATGSDRQAFR